jgi:gamma-glutamyltranspeptidase/glutathione hydrolase
MADWFASEKKETKGPGAVNVATAASSSASASSEEDILFCARRSPVLCRNGCVASSQPLASSIGVDLLRKGANAAEAAIAVAATLCVTEPCSTGLGGDMFCLYYDSKTQKVSCINGSGCSPEGLTLELLRKDCGTDDSSPSGAAAVDPDKFRFSAHAVTVPGAARGYEDVLKRYGSGKFTLAELLAPAVALAQDGFPVAPITSYHWSNGIPQLKKWVTEPGEQVPLTMDGENGPKAGDVFRNPDLARVLVELGEKGATKGFYEGETGKAIVEAIRKHGGVMTLKDLANHTCTFPDPISAEYRNVKLWQVPPNGQGIAGLIALSGLNHLEKEGACAKITPKNIGSADAFHAMIEMMRLGFADARKYVADPNHASVSNEFLLDPQRIGKRAQELFDPNKAVVQGAPMPSSCTVSFQVVDGQGNAISFVNSNFMGFGTGIVPKQCGFTLQNRGFGFSVEADHPNVIAPSKRPYHTIIPGMITFSDSNELHSTISNMGGFMQPQGHLQLTVDMVAGGLDPQAAIDMPRFCIANGTKEGKVLLESLINEKEVKELHRRGHDLEDGIRGHARAAMGRAQIIKRDPATGVLWAGSDGRADGCAMGF